MPPSIAIMLGEFMKENNCRAIPSLKYIELTGELLDEKIETLIRNSFNVYLANIYYSKVFGPIATSCRFGKLHIITDNVMIEVIKDGKSVMNEEGDIYITSLQNRAMPLIRIGIGDRGILHNETCSCGQTTSVIKLTNTRKCSFIRTSFGGKISSMVLRSLSEYVNEEVSRCLAYIRFYQINNECVNVNIGIKPAFYGWKEEIIHTFLRKIQDTELEQIKWNIITEVVRK